MARKQRPRDSSRYDEKRRVRAGEYAGRLRLVREFTKGFSASDGYDLRRIDKLSSAQKREINRYYDVLSQLSFRPHYVYHARSKRNLLAAKRTNGTEKLSKINVGIFQVPTRLTVDGRRAIVKPKIHVSRRGDVMLEFPQGTTRDTYLFEAYARAAAQEQMAQEYEEETGETADPDEFEPDDDDVLFLMEENLTELAQQIVDESDYNYYTVIVGQFERGKGVPKFFYKDKVVDEVVRLQSIYNDMERDDCDPDDPSSHHWRNWLFGINGYRFKNFQDQKDYVKAVRDHVTFREAVNKEMKAARKRVEYWEDQQTKLNRQRKISAHDRKIREREIERNIDKFNTIINGLIIRRARGKME